MPSFNNSPDTAPLTKEEKAWCRKLEKLLLSTPDRFGIYTIGDPELVVFDKDECVVRGIEQEDCFPSNNNLHLAQINSSEHIQGWCG